MRQTIVLARDLVAGETGTLSRKITTGGCYLRSMKICFDTGAAHKVNVRPYIDRHGEEQEDLVMYAQEAGAKHVIDGEGGLWMDFPLGRVMETDESICVDFTNSDLAAHVVTAHFFVEKPGEE